MLVMKARLVTVLILTVVASVGATQVGVLAVRGGGGHHGLGGGGQAHHVSAALALRRGGSQGSRQHEQVVVQSDPANVRAALVDGVGQGGGGGAGHVVGRVGGVDDVCEVLRDRAGAGINRN